MATAPSAWIAEHTGLIAKGGAVLDLACGSGRHTRLLLERGHPMTAIDRDIGRLADLLGHENLTARAVDLEDGSAWPFPGPWFDGIVVTNYLHRPLFPAIVATLAPGGVLLYETFARGNERFGRPRNPDHLLAEGELLRMVAGHLHVIAYQHGEVSAPRRAVVQRICAARSTDDRTSPAYRLRG
jgi:SAM-dependent methyltransferase